jgi:hypothetical protein
MPSGGSYTASICARRDIQTEAFSQPIRTLPPAGGTTSIVAALWFLLERGEGLGGSAGRVEASSPSLAGLQRARETRLP